MTYSREQLEKLSIDELVDIADDLNVSRWPKFSEDKILDLHQFNENSLEFFQSKFNEFIKGFHPKSQLCFDSDGDITIYQYNQPKNQEEITLIIELILMKQLELKEQEQKKKQAIENKEKELLTELLRKYKNQ